MNLPTIPSNFSSGEVLTADRMNQILDWMRSVSALLPGLELSTGQGLRISRTPSGTVLSVDPNANGADFTPPHPFHVRVLYDENATPAGIAISGGLVCVSCYVPFTETLEFNPVVSSNFCISAYINPQKIEENPAGKYLFLRYRRATYPADEAYADIRYKIDFLMTPDEYYDQREMMDGPNGNSAEFLSVRIAKFTQDQSGIILVDQYLRSDIFLTNGHTIDHT